MRTLSFNQFNGGMINDPRDPREAVSRICAHFDSYTYPYKLVPYHSSENGDTSASTNKIGRFVFTNNLLYGLSLETGTSQKLFAKSDMTTQTWPTTPANMNITAAYDGNAFIDYKGSLYMSRASQLDSYAYGSATLTTNVNGAGYVVVNQPVVHPADGFLYLPKATGVISYDGSTWTSSAFTLPDTNYTVVSITPYGIYLAIACINTNTNRSVVLLWNRDATVNTVSENIDWGEEIIKSIESFGGTLIGISSYSGSSSVFKDKIVFRSYSGGAPFGDKFNEIIIDGTTLVLGKTTQKLNNRIYFLAQTSINGSRYDGVWSIGRTNLTAPYSVVFDRLVNNDTGITSGILNGFILNTDYMFISYISSATYGMSKTDDQANFIATSIYETVINPQLPEGNVGLRSKNKQLQVAALSTSPLTAGQQVVVKYKVDGSGWVSIFSNNGSSAASNDLVTCERKFDVDGTPFTSGREYEFRFESTGGAEITEFKYSIEELTTTI